MRASWPKLLGSAAVLGLLVWWADMEQVLDRLKRADLTWLVLSLLALTSATLSMARRWQLTAHVLGLEIGLWRAIREYYLAQLINVTLPGGVLGDVGRAIRVRNDGDLRHAAGSVIAERLIGQIAMLSILFPGLTGALILPGGFDWPRGTAIALLAALGLCGLVLMLASRWDGARQILRWMRALMVRPAILAHAVVAAALLIFSLYACARATGTQVPPEGWVTILPLVFCAMLIPFSVAGWGWREGAAAALFPVFGAPASAGIAMGLIYGAMLVLAALPAVLLLLFCAPGERSSRRVAGI